MVTESWNIRSILEWTTGYFGRSGISEARLEAEVLLASVLKLPRLELSLRHEEPIAPDQLKEYKHLIRERQLRRPLAYILGVKEFMGLQFSVNEHTLIPRPETELLVEEVVKLAGADSIIADIGTGSGCIAVSTASLSGAAKVYATDISLEALRVAQENINRHGLAGRVVVKQGDMLSALKSESLEQKLDIIVSNPPYIPVDEIRTLEPELGFEPAAALDGGKDGLDFYRALARDSGQYLKPGGLLAAEMNAQKSSQIQELMRSAGFKIVRIVKDYSNLERIIITQWIK